MKKLPFKSIYSAIALVFYSLMGCAQVPPTATPLQGPADVQSVPNASEIKIIIPPGGTLSVAIKSALPVIQDVLTIIRCATDDSVMRQLNNYAIPGKNFTKLWGSSKYPMDNSMTAMRYHNKSSCVRVQTVEDWKHPALNVLDFKAIYFADDKLVIVK